MILLVFTTAFAFSVKTAVIAAATIGGLASWLLYAWPDGGRLDHRKLQLALAVFINVVPGIYIAVAVPLGESGYRWTSLLSGADYFQHSAAGVVSRLPRNIPKKARAGAGLTTLP